MMSESTIQTKAAKPAAIPAKDPAPPQNTPKRQRRGLFGQLYDLLSNLWTGVALLASLFVYSSVGSALPQVRQARSLEMTEFEWFHWWPFDVLIGLLFVTLVCTTLRRVPFNRLMLGTWIAHVGILTLGLGSWIYFGTKVEGDTPVIRRQVSITAPGAEPVSLPALPGNKVAVETETGRYDFQIASINPAWPILSGDDAGKKAYSVNVMVSHGEQQFIRQLLAGYPQYTEDIIPGQGRAVKSTGKKLVDDQLVLQLNYEPQDWFYLMDSRAIYFRQVGQKPWFQRPIEGLPRYHDYIQSQDQVWQGESIRPQALDIDVPARDAEDPLAQAKVRVTDYLRYAQFRRGYEPDGDRLNPMASLRYEPAQGQAQEHQLLAFDERQNETKVEQGKLRFTWVENEEQVATLQQGVPGQLGITVPAAQLTETKAIIETVATNKQLPMTSLGETGYSYRVQYVYDNLPLENGRMVSLAVVEIQSPTKRFTRWVCAEPMLTRDMPLAGAPDGHEKMEMDQGIVMTYVPGFAPALATLVAGPTEADGLTMLSKHPDGHVHREKAEVGQTFALAGGGKLQMTEYLPKAHPVVRPAVIPRSRREAEARDLYAMIHVEIELDGKVTREWLRYNQYVFESAQYNYPGRFFHDTMRFTLADGRQIEATFARRREKLPMAVALDDFQLTSHVGGYSGETASIRDWTSFLRFAGTDGWSDVRQISTNAPIEAGGYWFFQAYWDKPMLQRGGGGSRGFNFTGLGVGNRNGVHIQLLGCCIAVVGMLYAFYYKPVLRRRQMRQKAKAGAQGKTRAAQSPQMPAEAPAPGGGFKVAIGVVIGVLVLFSILMYGRRGGGAGDRTEPSAFSQAVDLSPLAQMAVHAGGRLKSFASFSHETLGYVSGPHQIAGQAPMFTYLDMMLRPQNYVGQEIVYVKNKVMRKQIGLMVMIERDMGQGWLKQFQKRGLISQELLQLPRVQELLARLELDLVRSAKFVQMITGAQIRMQPGVLAHDLRVVPPTGGQFQSRWYNIAEGIGSAAPQDAAHAQVSMGAGGAPEAGLTPQAEASLRSIWQKLSTSWRQQDVAGVNEAVAALAVLLPGIAPNLYPSERRLQWEAWYFEHGNLTWIWLIYMFSVVFLLMAVVYKWKGARLMGLLIFLIAFGLHTGALALRWYVSGRWPNSNMFEAVTTAAWFGGCGALLLEIWARRSEMRNLFVLCSACASMAALMAVHFLPVQLNPAIGNKMPVLHDIWLYIHTNVIIFSYCLIGMAAVTGTLYLFWRLCGGAMEYARAGGAASLILGDSGTGGQSLPAMRQAISKLKGKTGKAGRGNMANPPRRSSAGVVFDGATMVLMELAFVLLWTGLVMGAIWADHSWGRPWGWDPKEVFALNTFIVFLILIHVRTRVRDKGFWTAILAVAGCGVMLFNWIVINFVISGLHSYA